MTLVPVIWTAWLVSVLLLIGVSVYAARLGKNEEDQLFLSDSSSHARSEQDEIVKKVNRMQPIRKGAVVIVGLTSLCVVGYYVFDIFRQFSY